MVDPSPSHANSKRKHSSSSSGTSTSKSHHRQSVSATTSSKSTLPLTKYSSALNKFIDMELVDINPIKAWVRSYLETYHKDDAPLLEDLVFDRLNNEKVSDTGHRHCSLLLYCCMLFTPLVLKITFNLILRQWPDPKVLQTELGDVFMLPLDAREFVKRLWLTLTSQVNYRNSSSRKKIRKE